MIHQLHHYWKLLGPGLIYAGAAVGVSHLVQSTQAGAHFGYELVWAILLANFLKYPFFKLATHYTALTGRPLLQGYQELGHWALGLFVLITVATMFIIISAISVVTAGLFIKVFQWDIHIKMAVLIILLSSGAILYGEKLSRLNGLMKVMMMILSLTTIAATLSSFGHMAPEKGDSFEIGRHSHVIFLIALMGWMPAPLDTSVWQSQWYAAKFREEGQRPRPQETLWDFKIGYGITVILSLSFLTLGKNMMYGKGLHFGDSAVAFSGQLIDLYTQSLGKGLYGVIALTAFLTMASTTLTCLDAFPRILRESSLLLAPEYFREKKTFLFRLYLGVLILGSFSMTLILLDNMKALVNLATTISFLATPLIATLTYLTWQKTAPQPLGLAYRCLCWGSIGFFIVFCGLYLQIFLWPLH